MALARTIAADFHGEKAAAAAEKEFDQVFADGGLPDDLARHTFDSDEPLWIVKVVRECGFASSNGEARRLVAQGAVSLDGEKITDVEAAVPNDGAERVLKVGKRRFVRLTDA